MPNKTRKTPFRAPRAPSSFATPGRRQVPQDEPEVAEAPAPAPRRSPRTPPVDASKRGRHKEVPGKPERLHKLLAQSGIG